jgi:hypothetical protein
MKPLQGAGYVSESLHLKKSDPHNGTQTSRRSTYQGMHHPDFSLQVALGHNLWALRNIQLLGAPSHCDALPCQDRLEIESSGEAFFRGAFVKYG